MDTYWIRTLPQAQDVLAEKGMTIEPLEGRKGYSVNFKDGPADQRNEQPDLQSAVLTALADAGWRDSVLSRIEEAGFKGEYDPGSAEFSALNGGGRVVARGDCVQVFRQMERGQTGSRGVAFGSVASVRDGFERGSRAEPDAPRYAHGR